MTAAPAVRAAVTATWRVLAGLRYGDVQSTAATVSIGRRFGAEGGTVHNPDPMATPSDEVRAISLSGVGASQSMGSGRLNDHLPHWSDAGNLVSLVGPMDDHPLSRRELAGTLVVELDDITSLFEDVWIGGLNTRPDKAPSNVIEAQPGCSLSAALGWWTTE
jgi:hypothetical protein